MRVQIPPPGGHIGVEFGNAGNDGHGGGELRSWARPCHAGACAAVTGRRASQGSGTIWMVPAMPGTAGRIVNHKRVERSPCRARARSSANRTPGKRVHWSVSDPSRTNVPERKQRSADRGVDRGAAEGIYIRRLIRRMCLPQCSLPAADKS
jgi:hypothetical protein